MSRGAPGQWQHGIVPPRGVTIARTATCPECGDTVWTRGGRFAGHYYGERSTVLCRGSSQPIPTKETP